MDAQQKLLREVHDHFLANGEWPAVVPLQMKLRQLGNIPRLAAEIGREKIACNHESQDGVCQLTLRGLAEFEGSALAITQFLTVVRALAKHSIANGGNSINMIDVIRDMGFSESETRRVGQLIRMAPGLYSGMNSNASGVISITPNPNIWYFESVQTLDEYYAALERVREDERATYRQLRPAGYTTPPPALTGGITNAKPKAIKHNFVNEARLEQLRAIESTNFDLCRLIALCEELNVCSENGCVLATAMLTRAIIDHVPPIFGMSSFSEVVNNYSGTKSFGQSMRHLQQSRPIADGHLHLQIRAKDVLPTATQVDFSQNMDVLLSEIIRLLS